MNLIKPIIIAGLLMASMAAAATSTCKGEKHVGVRAGYITCNESGVGGILFQYRFSEHFRLAPNIDYVFRHEGVDALGVNLDVHMPFCINASEGAAFYPLAGVSCASWSHSDALNIVDVTTRQNRLGLNVGAGLEVKCSKSLKLLVEGKCNLVRYHTSGMLTVGLGYAF